MISLKIPQFQNANVMQLLLHEYTRTRMFKILHFGTKLHSIIYFEIFPSLTCKVKLIITFSSMSDGDLYEKKNYISLKDCEKAGRIKKYNIAVS